jgi:ESCRT-II complex subunit VPS22
MRQLGTQVKEVEMEKMGEQMDIFQKNLQEFASKYKRQINENPRFRKHFHEMCTSIGVDPLQSTKGFWSEVLGIGTFYYELSVQIVQYCYETRAANGGIVSLEEVTSFLTVLRSRGSIEQSVSVDDVERAVQVLRRLGNGFRLLKIGSQRMIQSVPVELSRDHESVLLVAQAAGGYVTVDALVEQMAWSNERANAALRPLLNEGMIWLDATPSPQRFYFPSLSSIAIV